MKTTAQGLTRIINAFGYSRQGLKAAYRYEAAFRQEVWLALILIPLALWLKLSAVSTVLLIGSVLLVLIVELVNSAIEAIVDRVGPEYHELSGRAKDVGSAAVLVAGVLMVVKWGGFLLEAFYIVLRYL